MKRNNVYSTLGSTAFGHGETDMKIVLHNLVSPEVSDDENPEMWSFLSEAMR